jgi:tRNA pseudouridine55 synthase
VSPATTAAPPRRAWRDVDGIVLLDKPPGLSSNQALQRVRRLLSAAKGGHAGTLDPMATGMLPLCFGQATKACGQLLGSTKAYRARLVLGSATDTGDADGAVIAESPVPDLDPEVIGRARKRYTGSIDQVPPMYSALKRDGRPLYELARRGEQVEREARRVRIERLDLVAAGDRELSIEVVCSKGTYIRVLGEDIAAALGTCGHLGELRRLWVEPFQHEAMVSLDAIEQWAGQRAPGGPGAAVAPWLLPVDRAFAGLPRLDLGPLETMHLRQGRVLQLAEGPVPTSRARAYGADGSFLGLVIADVAGEVRVERLFVPGAAGAAAGET